MISMSNATDDIIDAGSWLLLLEQQQNIIHVCENEVNQNSLMNKGVGSREKRVINKKSKKMCQCSCLHMFYFSLSPIFHILICINNMPSVYVCTHPLHSYF